MSIFRSRSGDLQQQQTVNVEEGQDSLALSAYLRLRREQRLTSPPAGSASVLSDRTRPYSYFNPQETLQTPMPTINRVDVSQQEISEAMLAVPDVSQQLDFVEEDINVNVDLSGLRLLLQTALRDKEILRRKLLDMQQTVEKAEKERHDAIEHSQMITSLTDSARKWRLPSLMTHFLSRYERNAIAKYLTLWKQRVLAYHASLQRAYNQRMILKIARRNILHARLHTIQSYFVRWKSNYLVHDILSVSKGPILNQLVEKRLNARVFQFLLRMTKRRRSLRRILSCYEHTHYRKTFFAWRKYLQYRTQEVILYSHRLLRLSLVQCITSTLQLSLQRSWQTWLKHTHYHRAIEIRQEKLCLVIRRLLRPEVLSFRKWKLKMFVWYPQQRKVRRLGQLMYSHFVQDRLRLSWQRWRKIITDRQLTCHKILNIFQRRESLHISRAFRTWNYAISQQREVEEKKRRLTMKKEKMKLTVSLLLIRTQHLTHIAFNSWRQNIHQLRYRTQHLSQLNDVGGEVQRLQSELQTELTNKKQAQLQCQELLQTHRHFSMMVGIKTIFRKLISLQQKNVFRSFQRWKHALHISTFYSHYNVQFTSLRKKQVLQSALFLQDRISSFQLRKVFQSWKLTFSKCKLIHKVLKKWQNRNYFVAFTTWKSRLMQQERELRILRRTVMKWLKVKVLRAWGFWKTKHYQLTKQSIKLRKLIVHISVSTLRQAWKRMKDVIHYDRIYHIHTIATRQKDDLESMVMRLYFDKLKMFSASLRIAKKFLGSVFRLIAMRLQQQSRLCFLQWKYQTHRKIRILDGIRGLAKLLFARDRLRKRVFLSHLRTNQIQLQKLENEELQAALHSLGNRLHSVVYDQQRLEMQHDSLSQENSRLQHGVEKQLETAVSLLYHRAQGTKKYRLFHIWQRHILQIKKQRIITKKIHLVTKREVLNHWKDLMKIVFIHQSKREQLVHVQSVFQLKNIFLHWRHVNKYTHHARVIFLSLLHKRIAIDQKCLKSRGFYRWLAVAPLIPRKIDKLLPLMEQWKMVVQIGKVRRKKIRKIVFMKMMQQKRLAVDRWFAVTSHHRYINQKLSVLTRHFHKLHQSYKFHYMQHAFNAWNTILEEESYQNFKQRKLIRIIRHWQRESLSKAWRRWYHTTSRFGKQCRVLKSILLRMMNTSQQIIKRNFSLWSQHTLYERRHAGDLHYRLVTYLKLKQINLLRKVVLSWFQVVKERGAVSLRGLQPDYEYVIKEVANHISSLFNCDSLTGALKTSDQSLSSLLRGSVYQAQAFFLRSLVDEDHPQFVGLSRHHFKHQSMNKSEINHSTTWKSPLSTRRSRYHEEVGNDTFEPFSPAGKTTIRTPLGMPELNTPKDRQRLRKEDYEEKKEMLEPLLDVYLLGEGLVGQCAETGMILRYSHHNQQQLIQEVDAENAPEGLAVLCIPLFYSHSGQLEDSRVMAVVQFVHEQSVNSSFDLLLARDRLLSPSRISSKFGGISDASLPPGQLLDSLLALRLSIPLTLAILSLTNAFSLVVHRLHYGEVQKDIHAQERDLVTQSLHQLQQEFEQLQLQRELENSHCQRLQQQLNEQQLSHQQLLVLMEKLKSSRQKYKEQCLISSQQNNLITNERDALSAELEKQKTEVTKLKQAMRKYSEQKQQIESLNKVLRTAAQDLLK